MVKGRRIHPLIPPMPELLWPTKPLRLGECLQVYEERD